MKKFFAAVAVVLLVVGGAFAQTNISIGSSNIQTGVLPTGVNLGQWSYYGSQQLSKNIFIDGNPGFQDAVVSNVMPCDLSASASTCQSSYYVNVGGGFWGSYIANMTVISGDQEGCTSTVTGYSVAATQNSTLTFTAMTGNSPVTGLACNAFSNNTGVLTGVPFVWIYKPLTQALTGTGYIPALGWQTYDYGTGGTWTNVSDAPPSPDSVSVYNNSLQFSVPASDTTGIKSQADPRTSIIANRQFIKLNGSYVMSFWAKLISGTPSVTVYIKRGGTVIYTHTYTGITSSWVNYTSTATLAETSPSGELEMDLEVSGGSSATVVNIGNVSFTEQTTIGNNTAFRDGVVQALTTLKPGVIRMWDDTTNNTSKLDNMLKDQFSRQPTTADNDELTIYPGYYNIISYSIPDFLKLCQTVGSSAWIVIPITWTTTDISNFIDYLSGGAGTTYGAKRIAQGQTTPWTSVVNHIYLELGNEQWNDGFGGSIMGSYNFYGYGAKGDELFAAAKSNSNYASSKMSLVIGTHFEDSYHLQPIMQLLTHADLASTGPYLMDHAIDFNYPDLGNSVLSEPWINYTPVGSANCMEFYNYNYLNSCPTEAAYNLPGSGSSTHQYGGGIFSMDAQSMLGSAHPVPFSFYEFGPNGTGIPPSGTTQAQQNSFLPSLAVGLATVNNSMLGMQNGVLVQNMFQLGQDYFFKNGLNMLEWGIVEDMGGPTNGRRPEYWAAQMANSAIPAGGNMLQVTQTGTPTRTIGSPSATLPYSNSGNINGIEGTNIPQVQAFAFSGSGTTGLVMFNISANAQAITFGGVNAPTGTVAVSTLSSATGDYTANNETNTTNIVPVTTSTTGSALASSGYTLPAYSEVVMTWTGSTVCAISPPSLSNGTVGTVYSQTVTASNCSASTYTITAGGLPAGLSLNASTGAITGTPTTANNYSFTISYSTASQPYTVTIAAASSGSYYLSNSGSDSNPCTLSQPCATIAKINSITLSAGNSIYFQSGGLWREQLTISQSGTAGNPINITSYGTGAQPVIDAANLASWTNVSGNVWSTSAATNPLYPNFSGTPGILVASQGALTAANQFYWDGTSTLYVYSAGNPASVVEIPARANAINANCQSYVTVSNLELRGAQTHGYQNLCATGITFNLFSNLLTHLNYSNGIYVAPSGATATSTNMTVSAVTASQNGASGIKFSAYSNGASQSQSNITGSTTLDNCRWPTNGGDENTYCGGIYIYGGAQSANNFTVAKNVSSFNGTNAPASFLNDLNIGTGIWFDTLTNGNSSHNTAIGNTANGIYFEKTIGSTGSYDLAYNNAGGGGAFLGNCAFAAGFGFQSTNNKFINETCTGTGYAGLVQNFETTVSGTDGMSGNQVINSLVGNSGGTGVFISSNQVNQTGYYTGTKNTVGYNSFGTANSNMFYFGGTFYSTYATFESAYCGSAGCSNSMQLNPRTWIGYNLLPTSPARNAGTAVNGFPNLCGGTSPDLGALPYNCEQSVSAGQTLTLTSPVSVNWSLQGNGTLSAATGTSVTYTAPASIPANQTMLGWSVLPPDTVFQANISGLPVDSRSSAWLATASTVPFNFLTAWGITPATSASPLYTLVPYYGDNYNNQPQFSVPFPGYASVKRENGAYTSGSITGNDHHSLIVNQSNGGFYDTYNERITLTGTPFSITYGCSYSGSNCNVQSVAAYNSSQLAMVPTSTDAAGTPLAALTWTLADIKSGPKHAARFTAAAGYIHNSVYLWPATAAAAGGVSSAPPYGSRWRLKSSVSGPVICGTNSDCVNMITAMQQYGLMLSDIGSNNQITVSSDAVEDPITRQAMALIGAAGLVPGNFDIVDESGLQQIQGLQSYQINPSGPVTPATYAVVTGGGSSVPIAFQPVGIGLNSNALAIAAGSYTYQIPFWVTPGSVSQTVAWTRQSGTCSGDSVSTGGIYTPPSSGAPCVAVLKGTAAADPTSVAYLYVSVFALSGSGSTAGYRIDINSLPSGNTTTDLNGNQWYNDFGIEAGSANFYPSADYPNWQKHGINITEYAQYGSYLYTYGGDVQWCGVVPNGNYRVRWGQGNAWNGNSAPQGNFSINAGFYYNPSYQSVNGTVVSHFWDWSVPIQYQWATPYDNYLYAQVTNNQLCTRTAKLLPDAAITSGSGLAPAYWSAGTQNYPNLSGTCSSGCVASTQAELLEIMPDSTAPGIVIDSQQMTSIVSGQVVRLWPVDRYTGSNMAATTWSVVNDPFGSTTLNANPDGSVNVTAGNSSTVLGGQPLIIKAVNGSYTATVALTTTGARYPVL